MENDQERDYDEEEYWKGRCPNCDEKHNALYPCVGELELDELDIQYDSPSLDDTIGEWPSYSN